MSLNGASELNTVSGGNPYDDLPKIFKNPISVYSGARSCWADILYRRKHIRGDLLAWFFPWILAVGIYGFGWLTQNPADKSMGGFFLTFMLVAVVGTMWVFGGVFVYGVNIFKHYHAIGKAASEFKAKYGFEILSNPPLEETEAFAKRLGL